MFTTGGKHLDAFERVLKAEFGGLIGEVTQGRPLAELLTRPVAPRRRTKFNDLTPAQKSEARQALAAANLVLPGEERNDDEDTDVEAQTQ